MNNYIPLVNLTYWKIFKMVIFIVGKGTILPKAYSMEKYFHDKMSSETVRAEQSSS